MTFWWNFYTGQWPAENSSVLIHLNHSKLPCLCTTAFATTAAFFLLQCVMYVNVRSCCWLQIYLSCSRNELGTPWCKACRIVFAVRHGILRCSVRAGSPYRTEQRTEQLTHPCSVRCSVTKFCSVFCYKCGRAFRLNTRIKCRTAKYTKLVRFNFPAVARALPSVMTGTRQNG